MKSHAVGVGQPLKPEFVRAAMLVRANTLAKGNSGVRSIVIETILEMLNKNVVPIIPSKGSLSCSGDLCLNSHMALTFSAPLTDQDDADNDVWFEG